MFENTRVLLIAAVFTLSACGQFETPQQVVAPEPQSSPVRPQIYASVPLTADLSALSASERAMLVPLIRAAEIMDELFWYQAYGDRDALLAGIQDPAARGFARINYGPWDRLAGLSPFIDGYDNKPPASNFYPHDMSREEFEAWDEPGKTGEYSYVRRDDSGQLMLVPYSVMHAEPLARAAAYLREAAALAEDESLRHYLELRADALVSDEYQPSDMAWMDMKSNRIELVIGPIEHYEDRLFGYRTAFEAFVLVRTWTGRSGLHDSRPSCPSCSAVCRCRMRTRRRHRAATPT